MSGAKFSVETSFPEIQRALDSMQKDMRERVLVRTLNGVTTQGRTRMSREIRQEFNLSAAKVNEALAVRPARWVRGNVILEAELYSPGRYGKRSLNVINFQARQTSKGVTVSITRGGGRKLIAEAFLGNKGRTVFQRVEGKVMGSRMHSKGAKHRQAIAPVQTIDVPQMFNTRRLNVRVVDFMVELFPRLFAREAAYYIDRFNKTGR